MKRHRTTVFAVLVASLLIIIAGLTLTGATYESQQENTPPCVGVLGAPMPIPDDHSQISFSEVIEERCPATWEEFVEFSSGGALDVASDIGEEEALQVLYDYNDRLMLEFNAAQ